MSTPEPQGANIALTKRGERAVAEGVLARQHAIEEKTAIRRAAGREVERLLALLDRLDADPDLEDGGDDEEEPAEPSLGWTSTFNQASRNRLGSDWIVDAEAEHDGREPDVDAEYIDADEFGIADSDALCDPEIMIGRGMPFDFDGSGRTIAKNMLRKAKSKTQDDYLAPALTRNMEERHATG